MKSLKERFTASSHPEPTANAVIIAGYIRSRCPVSVAGPGVAVMTTDEIISELADMADLSQAEVNDVLSGLGYTPGYSEQGRFGWMFKHIEQ